MKPPPFDMARPKHLEEALSLLQRHGEDARPIAGGQTLVPLLNLRMTSPALLIDLGRIESLAGISVEGECLRIGATTRQKLLLSDPIVATYAPLVAAAAYYIGHVQTRSRGTIGGSIAYADPAAELPLVMTTLGAHIEVRSLRGERLVSARDFFRGLLTTDLAADELITAVRIPAASPRARVGFRELARRHGDFAIVAAAAQTTPGERTSIRVGLGGVGPVPHACTSLERARDLDECRALIEAEVSALDPFSDLHASAEYRRHLARVLLEDVLTEVLA